MEFFKIRKKQLKKDLIEVYACFSNTPASDLMVQGKAFYAIWDEEKGLWSRNEYDVERLVDKELYAYADKLRATVGDDTKIIIRTLDDSESTGWLKYCNWVSHLPDNYVILDDKITYSDTITRKEDYVSKRLSYSIREGECPAFDELMSTLYSPIEREKIEWAIGSIIAGDSVKIQKFLVLYGEGGTGKGTVLAIIQKLFKEYYSVFNAKELVSQNNQFSSAAFKNNPLVAIQFDGQLDHIEDNTKLNSLVSHEEILINEKHKPAYPMAAKCFLFMGTNKPVQITDGKSGIIRRLIDVVPTGQLIEFKRYSQLMKQIDFELGEIAWRCRSVYESLGMGYYNNYKPIKMQIATDPFFNFVDTYYDTFVAKDGITLAEAYTLYDTYCDQANERKLRRTVFSDELKNYFREFYDRISIDGQRYRSWYAGFRTDRFEQGKIEKRPREAFMEFEYTESSLDEWWKDCPAQLDTGNPDWPLKVGWDKCETTLKDINTHEVHWVRPPNQSYIMVDFDYKDADGNKSPERNLKEASQWKPTYGELSKGGGVHLIYIYTGNPLELERFYDEHIEIKVYPDDKKLAMRRKVSKCNNLPIATISSGLPLKEATNSVVEAKQIETERHLRALLAKALLKKVKDCYSTHESMQFIEKILSECYAHEEFKYDVTDMYDDIHAFAAKSTNQSKDCLKIFNRLHFKSKVYEDEERGENVVGIITMKKLGNWEETPIDQLWFLDIECYKNLFLVCYKQIYSDVCLRSFNPDPRKVLEILSRPFGTFNGRRYDNHMMHYRMLGKNELECFENSQGIIVDKRKECMFSPAYNYSYIDVYDMCMEKMSLKKWEVKLDIPHDEMDIPWDKPAPPELWDRIGDYCENDVRATEAVFLANLGDYHVRLMLVKLCRALGMEAIPNDTTNQLTIKLITRGIKNPETHYVYTDLSTIFPGYKYEYSPEHKAYISTYRGEITGEGGYVYARKGMYRFVVTLDVDSMHPHSAIALKYFGDLTQNFKDLVDLRMYIKRGDFESARKMFGGVLNEYLDDPSEAKVLGQALKIVINSVYGLTAAKFPNPLRHPDNKDNIVAKYGALFMINLRHEVEDRGFTVVHCKTDSIKIVSPSDELLAFAQEYAAKYGFHFKVEARYERICLVNDAVYIAREEEEGWTATGAQFKHPVVFKRLFTHEDLTFKDYCETKAVSSAMYLDFNEDTYNDIVAEEANISSFEKELKRVEKTMTKFQERLLDENLTSEMAETIKNQLERIKNEDIPGIEGKILDAQTRLGELHRYKFIGKVGRFLPVKPGLGGGQLVRDQNGKYNFVGGTSEYRWKEAEVLEGDPNWLDQIDMRYYNGLCNDAVAAIEEFGSFEAFSDAS